MRNLKLETGGDNGTVPGNPGKDQCESRGGVDWWRAREGDRLTTSKFGFGKGLTWHGTRCGGVRGGEGWGW